MENAFKNYKPEIIRGAHFVKKLGAGMLSILPNVTLASHGDHVPSWLEEPAESGAEHMLYTGQRELFDATDF